MPSQVKSLGAPAISVFLIVLCHAAAAAETRTVRRGENLQTALNAAVAGDVILLEAGAEFLGNFVLPVKSGDLPIVVRSAPSSLLPPDGRRIRPSHVPLLARIRSPNASAALRTAPATRNWELRYLEFGANQNGYGDILQIGDGSSAQTSLDQVPHHITLAHLYIHGDVLVGQKRCIALNASYVTIRDSYIAECKGVGIDTQAIGGWNGPGPYLIENNYLEGAGENVMFGGSDPAIPNLVVDGVTVRRNFLSRPFAWRDPIIPTPQGLAATVGGGGQLPAGSYSYAVVARRHVGMGTIGRSTASPAIGVTVSDGGAVSLTWQAVPYATEYHVYRSAPGVQGVFWTVTATSWLDAGTGGQAGSVPTTSGTVWTVKNLFELKNARNVIVEANILENHWAQAQSGYAVVLTPRNSGGKCTWCVVEHVRFEYNILRRSKAGINLLGYDDPSRPTRQSQNLIIRNNLFHDLEDGTFFMIGGGPRDVILDHNTVSHRGSSLVYVYGGTSTDPTEVYGMRITNNAARHNAYGINGAFFSYGTAVINAFYPDGIVTRNYLAGGSASRYPAGNLTSGVFESEFVNAAEGNFSLRSDSQLRGAATDGGDIGANMGELLQRVAGVEDGLPGIPAPSPPDQLQIVR